MTSAAIGGGPCAGAAGAGRAPDKHGSDRHANRPACPPRFHQAHGGWDRPQGGPPGCRPLSGLHCMPACAAAGPCRAAEAGSADGHLACAAGLIQRPGGPPAPQPGAQPRPPAQRAGGGCVCEAGLCPGAADQHPMDSAHHTAHPGKAASPRRRGHAVAVCRAGRAGQGRGAVCPKCECALLDVPLASR